MNYNWKEAERSVAKLFNTRRTPLSGMNSGHDTNADTLHPTLYIEVKYSQHWPLFNLMRASRKKTPGLWIGVLIVGRKGTLAGVYATVILEDVNRFFSSLEPEGLSAEEMGRRFVAAAQTAVIKVPRSRPIAVFEDARIKAAREKKYPLVALREKGSNLTLGIIAGEDHENFFTAFAEEFLKSQGVNPK